MGKYFQEDIETASRETIEQWQNDGLLDVACIKIDAIKTFFWL